MNGPPAPRDPGPGAFPRLGLLALGWLLLWAPAYAWGYGWANFIQLCDLAVILTCVGLWRGSPLLLGMQAVSSMVIDVLWDLDLASRALTGRHLSGGTEYMWDPRFPLALRLLSFFHLFWPPLLWWALKRVGYDRRAFRAQTLLALVVLVISRMAGPDANLNFAHADPVTHRALGGAVTHLGLSALVLVGVFYVPIHVVLSGVMPRSRAVSGGRRSPEGAR